MRLTVEHMTGERQGRTEVVDSDTVTFGTDRACRIVLGAGVDGTVSPIHAEIAVQAAAPTIRDRSQGKGLLVNGESVTEAPLRDGDLVQFGKGGPRVRLRFPEQEARQQAPADDRRGIARDLRTDSSSPLLVGSVFGSPRSQGYCRPRLAAR